MGLIKDTSNAAFDTDEIGKGALICATNDRWQDPMTGIVSAVNAKEIRVLHQPTIANVTCFFIIPIHEVVAGSWEIRWSNDLQEIKEYIPETEGNGDDD